MKKLAQREDVKTRYPRLNGSNFEVIEPQKITKHLRLPKTFWGDPAKAVLLDMSWSVKIRLSVGPCTFGRHEVAMAVLKTYWSGDKVPESGVYKALHSTPHRLVWRVLYFEGNRFHRCKLCPLGVLYRLEEPCVPTSSSINLPNELAPLVPVGIAAKQSNSMRVKISGSGIATALLTGAHCAV